MREAICFTTQDITTFSGRMAFVVVMTRKWPSRCYFSVANVEIGQSQLLERST